MTRRPTRDERLKKGKYSPYKKQGYEYIPGPLKQATKEVK